MSKRKLIRAVGLLATGGLVALACEESDLTSRGPAEVPEGVVLQRTIPAVEAPVAFEVQEARERLLVRRATVALEVENVDTAVARIRDLAAELQARVEQLEQVGGPRETRRTQVTLRVPEAALDAAVERTRALGKVERVSLSEREVTEEVEDLDVRLRNLRRLEERLLRLLGERTGKLEEILAAERELARVREQIERSEGRLRALENEIAWSYLWVEMHEPLPLTARRDDGLARRFGRAFVQAGENFLDLVLVVIAALGYIVPLAAVVGLGVWVRRRVLARRMEG